MNIPARVQERLATAPAQRIGLDLASVYYSKPIAFGSGVLSERLFTLLDTVYAGGLRYIDAGRSYGQTAESLTAWLEQRPDVEDLVICSKWGFAYTGAGGQWGSTYTDGWRATAEAAHRYIDNVTAAYRRQIAEDRALLHGRLDLYQIDASSLHSAALTNHRLHGQLAELAASGVMIGLSTSGPDQADIIRAALAIRVGELPLFRSIASTYNVLETSAEPALAEAHAAGCVVTVKDATANGRIAHTRAAAVVDQVALETGTAREAVALAAVFRHPWADLVLTNTTTASQLAMNIAAKGIRLTAAQLSRLAEATAPPKAYWRCRTALHEYRSSRVAGSNSDA
ncbi:aldo/keto reductase [Streptomyces sp. NPDC005799]|uniref:aldo/keto reductase n=1 Tax=Streptomyces sp. NPDC005799 TaxID=3154678 RepID=UPI0033D945AA